MSKHYNSVLQLWTSLSKDIDPNQLKLELEVYKKLLNFFQVGEYFYVVFNLTIANLEYVSPNVEKILGYKSSEINLESYFNLIHPDDQPWFGNFENESAKFLTTLTREQLFNYKVQYDVRFRKKDGTYLRMLQQIITIQQYDDGGIFRTLGLITDISHIKPNGKPTLSFIGLNGEPSFINIQIGNPLIPFKEILSKREKEILRLIIEGKQNKEIADILKISKLTVDKHRKNMITRNNFKNSGELIAEAIKNGWL